MESVHEGIKAFKCKICSYKTAIKGNLKKHIETVHEGIKPFNCNICDYKCAQKYTLNKHKESVHEGIKPVPVDYNKKKHVCVCEQCGGSWSRKVLSS